MTENLAGGRVTIVAPQIGAKRCGNCKHQQCFPDFGDNKICTESPASVHLVPELFRAIPPKTALQTPEGEQIPFPNGGLQTVNWRTEVRFPPAPDHWTCGKWAPRFVDQDGNQLR